MHIIDKNGDLIEITDLEQAIEIAELYLSYHSDQSRGVDNPFKELAEQWYNYWQHIYQELMQLKADQQSES